MRSQLRLGGDDFELVSEGVPPWAGAGTVVRVRSERPLTVVEGLDAFARAHGWISAHQFVDIDQPALALRRLLAATRH